MKKNWWAVAALGMFVIVVVPLLIAGGLSFRLINTDTTNEWIGFWGGYLGSLIGGAITLYVMKETNKEARENLKITLQNGKELDQRKEKIEFCNMIISKGALWIESIETTTYRAITYISLDEKVRNSDDQSQMIQLNNYMISFTEQLQYTKIINQEMYFHFGVKIEQLEYTPEKAKELYELFKKMIQLLNDYNETVLRKNTSSDEIMKKSKELFDIGNNTMSKIAAYVKLLLKES